jgi:Phage integrase family
VDGLADLRWDQVDFAAATLRVRRAKRGTPAMHPILGDELRALRRLQREQEPKSPFVFTSERGAPFTTAGFARMTERAGKAAKFAFKARPHMLRHACGYTLANKGHDTRALQAYLGHRNIQHTVRYTSCRRRGSRTSGDSEVRSLRDGLNAGYLYLEVKCLGCDTHQTVALDIVRRRKTTPIHELERYMRYREGKNRKWAVATQTGS